MLRVWVTALLVVGAQAMTVGHQEGSEMPAELRPIVPGGSWFDDMAIERLRAHHRKLKEIGAPDPMEEHPEEKFIMSKLKDSELSIVAKEVDQSEPQAAALKAEDTRDTVHSFTEQGEAGGSPGANIAKSREFMEIYERELQKFFKNFMSVMLQAEIGGVSIENRSDEKKEEVSSPAKTDKAETNAVSTP